MFFRKKKEQDLIDKLIYVLERINLTDYIEYINNFNRIVYTNFVIGIARGLGYAIGFSVLGAIVIYVLAETGTVNIPVINQYLAKLFGK